MQSPCLPYLWDALELVSPTQASPIQVLVGLAWAGQVLPR